MTQNKYQRTINGAKVDVYDILLAFGVTCPATQHAIKKLLMPGQRGSKSKLDDLREAGVSVARAVNMASNTTAEALEGTVDSGCDVSGGCGAKEATKPAHGYHWEWMDFDPEDTHHGSAFIWSRTPEGNSWWDKAPWTEREERHAHMRELYAQDVAEGRV